LVSVIAHRGASARFRENTVEAFVGAARLGADGVELDVRRSGDGALVVHHDAVLPSGAHISNLSVAEIPAHVPLLDAALDACAELFVNIEVKNSPVEPDFDPAESVAAAVARVVAERGRQRSTLVSSFNLNAIDTARSVDPAVATGLLVVPGFDPLAALDVAARRGHAALNPHHSAVTPELVTRAHDLGLAVHTWTVDDPDRIRELAAFGVDAVITNVPDVAIAALRAG
jgi:glycerophosphoryl diester phosphodiesterase